eukprot:CAMPEP_0176046174 /NCGR_PEP_ID=MMETSP0120_2-20121206/22926_1 /TAXON_ID=160619 /ORGANISM="Kryptoperidinium foliaceum, Strain CCMP 1326" /LENGTH=200 /DNA_ID=CAMNT_0017379585 /DNA_START=66 /DNA_END=668 /DNA_ORIENTATION=-
MKTTAVFALLLATATAFNAPQFATRAVGKKVPAPVKKAVKKAPAPVKKAVKKVAPAAVSKPPPESKGYPSFAASAQNFRLGNISGGGNIKREPVFVHPTVNTAPPPDFDYKEAAKNRVTKAQEFVYEDGLTDLERKQRATLPAFLTGSAKSQADLSSIRDDIEVQEFAFGLDADRFQLLFITVFGLFTLVGCLSGTVSLD